MRARYNEIDQYCCGWLSNLMDANLITPGIIDDRSIEDVRPDDVRGFERVHWFAGIGGWDIALNLAGWGTRPVWTGSCPCQPFSSAGAGKAADDSRHLWPAWFPLIAECRPPTVFGEQVEAAIGWGWLDAVFADLEGQGYACGATVLPACGVGAPHIRQRLWFVADADGGHSGTEGLQRGRKHRQRAQDSRLGNGHLAVSPGQGRGAQRPAGAHGRSPQESGRLCDAGELGDTERPRLQEQRGLGSLPSGEGGADAREASERAGTSVGGVGDAEIERCEYGNSRSGDEGVDEGSCWGQEQIGDRRSLGFWSDCDWLPCTDGKARPVEPGSFPLAHGVQRRASKLRAFGNAIVPQVAAEFIRAAA